MAQRPAKDHWTQEAYSSSAPFVPKLATTVLQWLDPQPDDIVLDLGCGDGVLAAKLRETCASATGVDASASMITAAKKTYGSRAGLSWHVQDCRYLDRWINYQKEGYTKVFSNAALHWILRDPSTRKPVLQNVYDILRPGGTFAFEMGGKGNVAEVHAALIAAVAHQGITLEDARELCPWFFPSEALMRQMLENTGFKVQRMELEYRPTKLTADKDGGIEGWVRLMGAQFLEGLDSSSKRDAAVKEVCEVLKTVIGREEDGSMHLGYVRLRVLATKPT
ncbi:MAG: hypothetical protein L6R38_008280 [Xanthoria sp. 2 TBL-2021]|nr:MAG: hypothetical protein L6R38_008280 [Xanthoria sp. 2 TBL-2021]